MKSPQRVIVPRYRKCRGEITVINTVALLKNQGKWDSKVIPIVAFDRRERYFSEPRGIKARRGMDKDLYAYLGQGGHKGVKIICVG